MEDATELPSPSVALFILGALLAELRRENPKLLKRVRNRVCSGASMAATVRLRGPKMAPEMTRIAAESERWLEAWSLVADATELRRRA